MNAHNSDIVEVQMMIRKPAAEVFLALIDPAITTQFWFTKSSGKLEAGKTITWEWEMYGASAKVKVLELIPNKKIATQWGEPATSVDYEFKSLQSGNTYLVIKNYGFPETGDELVHKLKDSTAGFTSMLAGMKAYLEYGIRLNLVSDKYPPEVQSK